MPPEFPPKAPGLGPEDYLAPITENGQLPTEHQTRFREVMADLQDRMLAMYERTRQGHVRIYGEPMTLLDKVDLMVPS